MEEDHVGGAGMGEGESCAQTTAVQAHRYIDHNHAHLELVHLVANSYPCLDSYATHTAAFYPGFGTKSQDHW